MIRNIRFCGLVAGVWLAIGVPAGAQTAGGRNDQLLIVHPEETRSTIDLSGGYTFIRDSGRGQTMPAAWIVGLSFPLGPRWAVVGEADGAYKTVGTSAGDQQYRTHAFMGGIRAYFPVSGAQAPFVQALLGTTCYCGSTAQSDGKFARGLAVQVGAGVDVEVVHGLGVRLQGDVRRVNGDGIGFNQFRVAAGVVVGVGHR